MKKILTGMLFLVVLAVAACRDINVEDLDVAKEKWQNLMAEKYAFELRIDCECLGSEVTPARVIVENNKITGVNDVMTGDPMVNPFDSTLVIDNLTGLFKTVDDFFEEIDRARADADELNTDFDGTYGFPTLIYIDWMSKAVDDEVSYHLGGFEVL